MEITKTMLTLASYDLINVNGKEKQNLPRAVCSFAGGGGGGGWWWWANLGYFLKKEGQKWNVKKLVW